jgi:hypothetical protein
MLIVKDWPGVTVITVGVTDIAVSTVLERVARVQAPRRSTAMATIRSLFKRLA